MRLATFVYNRLLCAGNGVSRRFWGLSRKLLIRFFNDPSCLVEIHGKLLSLPLSHAKPQYLRAHSHYDTLLGRLSDYLRNRRGFLKCADVGANVGDTVAACSMRDSDAFLAIEPNPRFNEYLRQNFGNCRNVRILGVCCSSCSGRAAYRVHDWAGTAFFATDQQGTPMQVKTIDELVTENPEFSDLNLLKVDTDGHDFHVIAGAKQVITQNMPAILFECDAHGNERYVEDSLETLSLLKHAGYESLLAYDNYGYLMGRHCLDALLSFKQLLVYQLTSRFLYFDLLLMRESELRAFLSLEFAHFIDHMANKKLQRTAKAAAEV